MYIFLVRRYSIKLIDWCFCFYNLQPREPLTLNLFCLYPLHKIPYLSLPNYDTRKTTIHHSILTFESALMLSSKPVQCIVIKTKMLMLFSDTISFDIIQNTWTTLGRSACAIYEPMSLEDLLGYTNHKTIILTPPVSQRLNRHRIC